MRHHRWFKILALLFPLALLAAACGGDDDDSASGGDSSSTTAKGGDGLKVGLIYDLGGRGDQSFNDAAGVGLDKAKEDFGIDAQELEPDEGGENREELLRLLADDGNELIFGIGFLFGDSMRATAPDYPDTQFAIVDESDPDGLLEVAPNVAPLTFAEEQGSYLMGAAAALTSKSGKIGFIGGVETDLIKKFEAGYAAGATKVKPDIQIDVKYISQAPDFSGFNDPAKAKEIGAAEFGSGIDVVYAAAGGSGSGMFNAAKEYSEANNTKVWGIGVDSDQYKTLGDPSLQPYVLTSMLKKVDVAVYDAIKRVVDGEKIGGTHVTYDLKVDGVDYSTTGGFLDSIKDQIDELKQQIIDGTITVPTK